VAARLALYRRRHPHSGGNGHRHRYRRRLYQCRRAGRNHLSGDRPAVPGEDHSGRAAHVDPGARRGLSPHLGRETFASSRREKCLMNTLEAFRWIIGNPDTFWGAFNRHMVLCLVSLGIAALLSIPLGVAVARAPRASFIAINIAGAARSIPSLAILAAAMPLIGIGLYPSLI